MGVRANWFVEDLDVDTADTSCLACPMSCRDEAVLASGLCDVGREQERVATRLAALKLRGH
jgi:hypothetical protein